MRRQAISWKQVFGDDDAEITSNRNAISPGTEYAKKYIAIGYHNDFVEADISVEAQCFAILEIQQENDINAKGMEYDVLLVS